MRRPKQPKAIYSSLDDIAAEVSRIAQASPAPPDLEVEAPGEMVQKIEEPDPLGSRSGNGGAASEATGQPVSLMDWALPDASAKTEAAGAEPKPRFLGRKVEAKDLCPGCSQDLLWRVNRDGWMRLLPGSKHFMCDTCEARFLTFCGKTVRLD